MMDFNKEKLMQYIKTSNFDSLHIDHGWKKRFFFLKRKIFIQIIKIIFNIYFFYEIYKYLIFYLFREVGLLLLGSFATDIVFF
jgi:hypothetical protein